MKLRHFFILPIMAAVTLFTSCGDNNETTEPEFKLTPPGGVVKAEPGIIGVDSKGELTLDGWKADNPAYIVLFKWGSLIAMKGYGDWISGITNIAWAPKEYKSKLGNITNYASVPYAKEVFPTDSPAEGLGDPCHFAKKDGVAGYYRMPTGNPYEQFTDAGWVESGGTFGQPGRNSVEGQFYPAAGARDNNGTDYQSTHGAYWSSSPLNATNGYYLLFLASNVVPVFYDSYTVGFSVRCVRK